MPKKKALTKRKPNGKKAKTVKARKKKEEEAPQLIVASRIKEYAAEQGYRVAGEFTGEFNRQVFNLLRRGIKRASNNGRATLRPYDM